MIGDAATAFGAAWAQIAPTGVAIIPLLIGVRWLAAVNTPPRAYRAIWRHLRRSPKPEQTPESVKPVALRDELAALRDEDHQRLPKVVHVFPTNVNLDNLGTNIP